jgi:hypothetical protein
LLLAVLASVPASSYLSNYTSSGSNTGQDKWAAIPAQWHLNPATQGNIVGSRPVADVMQASFNTWSAVPGALLSAQRGADTSVSDAGFDSLNLMCFVCSGDFSEEKETLAVTITTTATQVGASDGRGGTTQFVGQILDSDILFNPNRDFATQGAGIDDEDLQTIATHEIGHFFGLDHSAVVRSVMFPFSPHVQQRLSYDDAVGIAIKYPAGANQGGIIAGSVRKNGSPVFGAHVFAESTTGAEPLAQFNLRKSPISTLSFADGTFRIEGLPADSYTITAEPLDLPVENRDVEDFGEAFGDRSVQTNFTTRWF